jgi:diguanylate cyclase (GGDEF)-like protein/PAS domain S-box-containing protein
MVEARVRPDCAARWPAAVPTVQAGVAVAGCAWFVLNLVVPVGPTALLWLSAPLTCWLAVPPCWRVARRAELTAPARRFWHCLAMCLLLAGVASVLQAYEAIAGPGAPTRQQGPASVTGYGCAVAALVYGMVRLPIHERRRRADRLTLVLDVGTVMLTAAVFTWFFVTVPQARRHSATDTTLLATLGVVVLTLAGVFALVRVVLSAGTAADPGALRLLALAVVIAEVIGTLPDRWLAGDPRLQTPQYTLPVVTALLILAMRRQWQALSGPDRTVVGRRRRAFSVLPYASVAATDALLVHVVSTRDSDALGVACAAVLLTAVVVVRQVLAFRENNRLLETIGRNERRFRSLVQNASDIIFTTDPDGVLTYVSPAIERQLGRTARECIGRIGRDLVHPADAEPARARLLAADRTSNTLVYQARLAHRDGHWRWFEVTSTDLRDDPEVGGIISNARDVTDARRLQERLSHQATHDSLTRLANRTLFGDRLQAALSTPDGEPAVGIALIDLDDFKAVNDTLGHTVGDRLLVAAAERLLESVREPDTVARLGGDEFAVVCSGATTADLDAMAHRIAAKFAAPVRVDGHELALRASIGVTLSDVGGAGRGVDATELLRRADVAMYAAKATRGGPHVHYSPDLTSSRLEQIRLGTELRRAIGGGELRLHYQPVVTLPERRLVGVEALVRWQHPERGLLGPNEFIPAAERSGLIVDLGSWVLTQACRQLADWDATLGPAAPRTLNVNVSPVQLAEPGFPAEVAAALAANGLPADRLTVEVTETVALAGEEPVRSLRRLRAAGVGIAMDDFGTGESSLTALDACPADELKLDRSFVAGADGPEPGVAAALVAFGATLGVRLVAEGVETEEQAQHLYALGYRLAQGYLFCRPVPADDIERRILGTGPGALLASPA